MAPALPSAWLERLAAHEPAGGPETAAGPGPAGPQAAVAALLRASERGPEVLLMQRVAREGDLWSGQVSLPGGRAQAGDEDLLATALRETREEVGVDLGAAARLVGRLARFQATARGGRVDLWITPFVFVAEAPVSPRPGPEAEAVFWLPLEQAAGGALDGVHRHVRDGEELSLPCWRVEERVVWGMTYRVVCLLLAIAREAD